MRKIIVYFLVLVSLIIFASATPLDDYYNSIDYSCTLDVDCVVKDVGNCCGANPVCVNSGAIVDPDHVNQICTDNSLSSTCSIDVVVGCACVNNVCEKRSTALQDPDVRFELIIPEDLNKDNMVDKNDLLWLLEPGNLEKFWNEIANQDVYLASKILYDIRHAGE